MNNDNKHDVISEMSAEEKVEKECKGCLTNVLLRPGEGFCESCASYREMPGEGEQA